MPRKRQHESKPDDAIIAARRLEALELRKGGASYRAIGERLKISHEQARLDIMVCLAELAEQQTENTAKYRQLELERLDRLQMSLWVQALGAGTKPPDTRAALALLRLFERRAKLLGLDAPTSIHVTDWRDQAIAKIQAGAIDYAALKEVTHDQPGLAEELFAAAGVAVTTGGG